jgi:hypothetical protein
MRRLSLSLGFYFSCIFSMEHDSLRSSSGLPASKPISIPPRKTLQIQDNKKSAKSLSLNKNGSPEPVRSNERSSSRVYSGSSVRIVISDSESHSHSDSDTEQVYESSKDNLQTAYYSKPIVKALQQSTKKQ